MSAKRILIVGCGKIGLRVANLLSTNHEVWGLRRSIQNKSTDSAGNEISPHIQFIAADVCKPESLNDQLPENLDYLIYCIAPTERNEAAYREVYLTGLQNIISSLPNLEVLKHLYFISSTSVYHQDDHSLVDETSLTLPSSFSGRVILEAEAYCKHLPTPSTIIRFSGIYGASRSRLIEQVKKHDAKLSSSCRLTNRIHEDDCVSFIHHLIQQNMQGKVNEPIYLASDSDPVDLNEVIKFLASTLGLELTEEPSNDAEKRRAGNKKCNNQKMLDSGYQFHFPSYREGYLEMIKAMTKRSL
ncbi:MAG: nucleoside-diphosphate-sugar epimerase [Oleiphilaceae bacterium]|jgi:nucleoside-diphosphate-sugar epimerase